MPEKKGIFPKTAMMAVACASFMDSFCFQIIVPNLPFAVQKWFPNISETEVGYYYGYIVSSYSLGGVFGALFWGWFADSYGRKTSIISCLSCQMFLSLFFGLSTNYYVALVIRTLWGFTNGNLGVLKTYVSETCSEDMQSLGFSIIVTMGGIANVVGPSLGGFLGDAESYFPRLIQKFPWIRERPLFLPCIIGSFLSVVILILVLAFLPESLTKAMRIANAEEQKKTKKRYQEIRETMRKNPDYVPSVDDRYILQLNQGDYFSLICNYDVLVSCIIYGIYGSIQGGQDALYPIWLINSPENHGFSLTSSDLGWLYTGVSPMQIFSTPLLFPQLTRLMTNKQVSYVTGYIYAFLLLLNPLAALANRSHVIWQWIVILFSYGLSQCFRFFFVTYPCQQRVLSLGTLPSFHERHGVHHQQHLSGLPRQSQRTRPSHVRLRPLCGPLGVLQRLRVVVQERTGLPVRLRMRVLCGRRENEVSCSSSPWCRPSTRRSPPCCPSP